MYIITHKYRILNKAKKKNTCACYRSIVYIGIRSLVTVIGLLYLSNQEKITARFAVQVCGSKKSFAVAEVPKITAKLPLTCGFAVADHPLLVCRIYGCGIESKFAVYSNGAW